MKLRKFIEQKYKEYKNSLHLPDGIDAKFTAFRIFDEKVNADIIYLHFLREVENGWNNMQLIAFEELDENNYKQVAAASYKYGNFTKLIEDVITEAPNRYRAPAHKIKEVQISSAHLGSFDMQVYWENNIIDVVKTVILSKATDIFPEKYIYYYNNKMKDEKELGSRFLSLLDGHKLQLKTPSTKCSVSYSMGLESLSDKSSEMIMALGFELNNGVNNVCVRKIGEIDILNIKKDAFHLKQNITERATITHEIKKQIII